MRYIMTVFKYELQRNLARKGFLFTTFALPVLMFLAYFGVNAIAQNANDDDSTTSTQEQDVFTDVASGYVDLSGVFAEAGDLSEWKLSYYPDEASAQTAMDNGEIDIFYIIAEDFVETQDVRLVLPTFSLEGFSEAPIRQLLLNVLSDDVATEVLLRLQFPVFVEEIRLESQADDDGVIIDADVQEEQEEDNFIVVYGFSILFMLAIFGTNGYLMQTVISEKESRVVEILISSVKPLYLLAGKILAMGVLGIIQIGVWVGTILILTQIAGNSSNLPSQLDFMNGISEQLTVDVVLMVLLYFVLGYLFFAAIFAAVGAISESMANGPNFAAIFVMPATVLPMIMLNEFITSPNEGLPQILSLIPITAPISMIMRLTVVDVPIVEVVISVVLLIIFDIGMIWLAGRFFRAQSLLAGQTPKLRDIPAILRG